MSNSMGGAYFFFGGYTGDFYSDEEHKAMEKRICHENQDEKGKKTSEESEEQRERE